MDGAAELFGAVEAALNDREIAAYEDFTDAIREVLALARKAEALQRENAELREALKPFAVKYADITPSDDEILGGARHPDEMDVDELALITISIGSLRRARALLGGENAGN